METCVYEGRVTHARRVPAHRFEMRLFALYLDLSELESALAGRWLCSATRAAPLRIRRADYPGDPGEPLDSSVRNLVARSLGTRPVGPIGLLTQPRTFGYGFNPVSFFYCFDPAGSRIEFVVAHVTNTPWGEQHSYVLTADDARDRTFRARRSKQLHVSPFLPMDLSHEFSFDPPGERLHVGISDVRGNERVFAATLAMTRRPLTAATLARVLLRYPVLGAQVVGRIYWEAWKLHRKGAAIFPHPTYDKGSPTT